MRGAVLFALVSILAVATACRRTGTVRPESESVDAEAAESSSAGSAFGFNPPSEPRDLPDGELPPPPPPPPESVTTTTTTEKPVDPFDRAIADVRAGALSCFSSLPPGEYAATLVMTATAMGRVTRSEVEAGNVTDESVLACLRSYAESRSFPTSPKGRTVRVEVRVKG